MKKKKRFLDIITVLLVLFFMLILITESEICKNGTISGILLSGRVIIPSLFPFAVCVLFIMNSGMLNGLESVFSFSKLKGRICADIFFIVLLSFIGGYPIGAKLLNNAVEENRITAKKAGKTLNYCINAGPAFIISAVGGGILNSKKLGVILLCSHIFSGLILIFISNFKGEYEETVLSDKRININLADNFVKSVAEASGTVLSICSFVILFSAINAYINFLAEKISAVRVLGLILEITNATTLTNNIYVIAFLLGFGGISIWCQVISVSGKLEINFLRFIIFRILHGVFSVGFAAVLLKLFPVNISVFSNIKKFAFSYFYSTASVGISLLIMGIVFIISVSSKKYVGKILEDVV